jgi:excisionase family DNA binding protein
MNFQKTAPKTVPETARALGISRHTVRAWIAQRRIGYLKLGRSVRIPQAEIERILRESAVPAEPRRRAAGNHSRTA